MLYSQLRTSVMGSLRRESYRTAPLLIVLIVCLYSSPAQACLNDRDTLANEANRLPNVLQVVSGRFERNPPLYYEMRIRRVAAELKLHPERLSDYDDWSRLRPNRT